MPLAYFDRFVIDLTQEDAETGSHSGSCDDDIAWLRTQTRVQEELDRIPADDLRAELKEYGAWSEEELADHENNLDRILWLACGNILDNPGE